MRIAVVANSPYRDLPAATLTAMRLCQGGASCYLAPAYVSGRELWALAPDYVLLENFGAANQGLARGLMQAGVRVGVLDTDAGVFRDVEWYGARLGRDPAVRHKVSCFCAWGQAMAQQAVQKGWFLPSQVRLTGTPRLDFYAEPWRQAALRLSWYAEVVPPPMVLIAGNFHYANPSDGNTEVALRTRLSMPGQTEASLRRWLEVERVTWRQMAELTNRLAARLPEVQFVYRPHPFENLTTYDDLLETRPNLRLIRQGTVDGWILRACAVIQKGSTTAIEATLAGVPALSPAWIPTPLRIETVEAVSIPCASEEDLVECLYSAAHDQRSLLDRVRGNLNGVLSTWFHDVDGRAHDRVAEAILESAGGTTGLVSLDRCEDALDGLLAARPTWKRRARAGLRRGLHLPVDWSFRRWRRTPDRRWDSSPRRWGVEQVQALAQAIEPSARSLYGPRWRPVAIRPAMAVEDYHFGYAPGHATALIAAA